MIEMAIRLAFLWHNFSHHSAQLFKAFEGEVERLVIERNSPAKRPLDILFDLVAMPWMLPQHGKDHDLAIHTLLPHRILALMSKDTRYKERCQAFIALDNSPLFNYSIE